ncbi:hypothetical protein M426DRAFT_317419 [Hypoxylon sp. CI-4A]|nr:hypothetical protein M426DRAFT_317419 [Hypoxylon sp. CI-4A]
MHTSTDSIAVRAGYLGSACLFKRTQTYPSSTHDKPARRIAQDFQNGNTTRQSLSLPCAILTSRSATHACPPTQVAPSSPRHARGETCVRAGSFEINPLVDTGKRPRHHCASSKIRAFCPPRIGPYVLRRASYCVSGSKLRQRTNERTTLPQYAGDI